MSSSNASTLSADYVTSLAGSKHLISWIGGIHIPHLPSTWNNPALNREKKRNLYLHYYAILFSNLTGINLWSSWGISLLSRYPLGWIFQRFDWRLMKRQRDAARGVWGRVCQLMKTKSILIWKSTEPIVIRGGPWRMELITSHRVGPIDGQVKSRARGRTASWEDVYLETITDVYGECAYRVITSTES